jgi:epoxyqueuosine reductase
VGSWLLLGEILVDMELVYDQPATDHCGTCTRCIDACPTEAIVAPYMVDARACISYLTIELKGSIPERWRPMIGNRIFGCDDCQDVCPWNRRAPATLEPEFLPRKSTDTPSLIDLMGMTPEDFRSHFKGSPIKRSKRRGLLRNVAVALGNAADPRAVPVLIEALGDEEPLVREHAAWALGQLGSDETRPALEQAKESETEQGVLEEIQQALDRI